MHILLGGISESFLDQNDALRYLFQGSKCFIVNVSYEIKASVTPGMFMVLIKFRGGIGPADFSFSTKQSNWRMKNINITPSEYNKMKAECTECLGKTNDDPSRSVTLCVGNESQYIPNRPVAKAFLVALIKNYEVKKSQQQPLGGKQRKQ